MREQIRGLVFFACALVALGAPAAAAPSKGAGGAIAGRITGQANGQPLEGVAVEVRRANGFQHLQVQTGADGFYAVGGLEPGEHFVRVRAEGYVDEVYDDIACVTCDPLQGTPLQVGQGLTPGVDFALVREASIRGEVVTDGSFFGEVTLLLYDAQGERLSSASNGPDGYLIDGLPAGTYFLATMSYGDLEDELWRDIPCSPSCDPTTGTPIVLSSDETFVADFLLVDPTSGAIAGQVTEVATGAPIAFVRVVAFDASGSQIGTDSTDTSGAYRIDSLPPDAVFLRAESSHDEYMDEVYDDIPCPLDCDVTQGQAVQVALGLTTGGIDFALARNGTISGTLLEAATGVPLSPSSLIRISFADGSFADAPWVADGAYQSDPLPPGTYFVSTNIGGSHRNELYDDLPCPVGSPCDPTNGMAITLGLGEAVQGIDFLVDRLGTISGLVHDALTGTPVHKAEVTLYGDALDAPKIQQASTAGSYAFTGLEPGSYFLSAELPGLYKSELYAELSCPGSGCDPNLGTPLIVGLNQGRRVDFGLTPIGATDPGPAVDPRACQVDVQPAATLLFPYFEVEAANPAGLTTLISINNAAAESHLAQVTLWTDWGEPSLAFSLYLTGYDVQTINLRDILSAGILPSTGTNLSNQGSLSGDNASFPGCSNASAPGAGPAFPNPALDGATRAHLQAWHSGEQSPMTGTCAGSLQEGRWTGYVTVDVVRRCSESNPTDFGYFLDGGEGLATNDNVLFGDLFLVTSEEDFAQGEPALHLRADSEAFPFGAYTFYGQHWNGDGRDDRQPLGSAYAFRYLNGGVFTGGTELIVWRDSKSAAGGQVACGTEPSWAPLPTAPILAFDEEENPQILPDESSAFPYRTQRVQVGGAALPTVADFGWMWLDLAHDGGGLFGQRAQGHVLGVMNALGRFSVGFRAARTASVCEP